MMDVVDRLFVNMFDKLNERCKKELEAIGKQYPFTPLKVIQILFFFHLCNSNVFGSWILAESDGTGIQDSILGCVWLLNGLRI